MARRGTRLTAQARALFLAELAQHANVTYSARVAGLSRETAYALRSKDAAFAVAWDDALEQAADTLEREAFRRAHEGVPEPVVSMGKLLRADDGTPMTVLKYSDTLLLQLMKAARPAKFRDNLNVTSQATSFGVTVVMERIQNDPRYAERATEFARLIAGAADESGSPV